MLLALLTVGVGTAIAVAAWWSSESQRIRRLLASARTFTIGELGEGRAGRIIGTARVHGDALVGPLTGRRCLHYVVHVDEQGLTGKASAWHTIITESRSVVFALEDTTGRALVDATSARIALDFDVQEYSGAFDKPTELQHAFLARHHCDPTNRSLRYREAVIADGEAIAVLGGATSEPDPDALPTDAYRGALPTRLRFTSSRRHPLVISDHTSTTQ